MLDARYLILDTARQTLFLRFFTEHRLLITDYFFWFLDTGRSEA